jgi:molecular chaperone IbpA
LHKGIANRSFKRVFTLAENVEVRSADLEHGMLKIVLESVIPEHKKPKKIEIGTGLSATQLLLENEADESNNG